METVSDILGKMGFEAPVYTKLPGPGEKIVVHVVPGIVKVRMDPITRKMIYQDSGSRYFVDDALTQEIFMKIR